MRLDPKPQLCSSVAFEPGIFGSGVEVLTQYVYPNLGKYLEIKLMDPINFFGDGIFGKRITKNSLKI